MGLEQKQNEEELGLRSRIGRNSKLRRNEA
jgi:hypothetical protein